MSLRRDVARLAGPVVILVGMLAGRDASAQTPANGCISCHATLTQAALAAPATAFQTDIHRESGFTCVDCHGGDPTTTDKERAKAPARGYLGRPAGMAIIATCARCHSDAEFMRKFAPRQRIDQASEYASSVHGKLLATGDHNVATCISCHGAHGVIKVSDARSPAFPTNVAATCGGCHSNPQHMQGYKLPSGDEIPTNQRAEYERSVHYAALIKGNDLSAPTCNDCHGNHGAAPPGVGAVTNVCGTCHAVFAERFATSAHSQVFDRACVECHSNHAVLPTSDAMLGTSSQAVCSTCHSEQDDPGFVAAARMRNSIDRLRGGIDRDVALITRLENAGMEMSRHQLALVEARTKLTQARTEIHGMNPALVEPVIDEGMKIVAGVDQAGIQGGADLAFRRRGLFVSLGAIVLVLLALVLKIRELDRR